MQVHLVDGTYELFRHHFGVPSHLDPDGMEVAAVRGVRGSVLTLLEQGATHVGVATDHVIESFRNDLWPTYKTSEGMPPELLAQFPLLEEALDALGVVVWPMVDLEADDALASAAAVAVADGRVERVLICTPDKDLAQCVVDPVVVQVDRRAKEIRDAEGVRAKFGVEPARIPDLLALVGDPQDGYPGIAGIGQMRYAYFAPYNVTGALVWVLSFLFAGYWFGQLPAIKRNFHIVILAIIVISILPMVFEYLRARREGAAEGRA